MGVASLLRRLAATAVCASGSEELFKWAVWGVRRLRVYSRHAYVVVVALLA